MAHRRYRLAIIGAAFAAAVWLFLQWSAAPPLVLISNEAPRPHGSHRQLVVLLHGYQRTGESLADVRQAVEQSLPDADIMVPEFPTALLTNVSALELASAISDAIERVYQGREAGYPEIILVGHSIGSLLARKAFVIGRGETEEVSQTGFRQRPRQWALHVSRIVLMAGMNRGWSISSGGGSVAFPKAAAISLATPVARALGLGRMILGLRRGSPFVSNLSLQWLNLIQQGAPMPIVTQLLGANDDLVFGADNIDLYSGRSFYYRRVRNTGHAGIIDFQDPATGAERRNAFVAALEAPEDSLRAANEYEPTLPAPDPSIEKVIFVMHGIRDFGDWTAGAAQALEREAQSRNIRVKVITSGYGYFPMAGFLLFQERQKNVRWFVDKYTEARALYPNAAISFLGHSNGTYLLASALLNYQSCKVDRVVFVGSVVRRDFQWSRLIHARRVNAVRNYVATADWVVGFFPYFFEVLNRGDIGGAGLLGFTDGEAQRAEVRYVSGGHGAGLAPPYLADSAAFLIDPTAPLPAAPVSTMQNAFIVTVSKICWAVWILLAGPLAVLGYLVAFRGVAPSKRRWERLAAYVFLVALFLNTV